MLSKAVVLHIVLSRLWLSGLDSGHERYPGGTSAWDILESCGSGGDMRALTSSSSTPSNRPSQRSGCEKVRELAGCSYAGSMIAGFVYEPCMRASINSSSTPSSLPLKVSTSLLLPGYMSANPETRRRGLTAEDLAPETLEIRLAGGKVFRGDIYLLKSVGVGVCRVAADKDLEILGVERECKARIIMAAFVLGLEQHYDLRTSVVASTHPSCLVIGRAIRVTVIHVSIHVCNCPWRRTG
jgi:hypothetical protein